MFRFTVIITVALATKTVSADWQPPTVKGYVSTNVPVAEPEPLPDGRELVLVYTKDCVHGPEAVRNAKASGIPVRIIVANDDPITAINLWKSIETDYACPAWILLQNDKVIKSWIGASNAAGVTVMARYNTPVQQSAPIQRVVQRINSGPVYYGQYPSAWMWPGELSQHLASNHGINTSGMTPQQMIAAHNAAHGSRRTYSAPIRYSAPVRYSYCPGGSCP